MRAASSLLLFLAVAAHAEITNRYLLHDFNNGKAVGKNVFDAGPLSDRDEQQFSQTKVQVGGVGDGAEGQAIKVSIDMPPNAALGYEYGGIYFSQDRFDASAFGALHFQMRLPSGKPFFFPLKAAVTDDDPIYGKTDYEANLAFYLKDENGWQDVVIPFSRLLDKRANSLRGRRITAVSFSLSKAGNYEFQLDTLEFASARDGGFLGAMGKARPEIKAVARYIDDQDFKKAAVHDEYVNIQLSPRFGYAELRAGVSAGDANGTAGLVDFSKLSQTSRTPLQPAFFAYPKGEVGVSLIFDGWGKNWLGIKSVSLGNNLVHYSDATFFQSWFPAWTAPAGSSLPLLGSARIQGEHYDAFAAYADVQGTDAQTAGAKVEIDGFQLIAGTTSLAARAFGKGKPVTPVYSDAEATAQYSLGRYKDPIRFSLWGGLFSSTDYYLASDIGRKFFDVDSNRVIKNQKLLSPTAKTDQGLSARLFLSEFLLKGNMLALNAEWVGPSLKPLFRDYYGGGVDDLYFDSAGAGANMSQAIWQLTLRGGVSEGTAPSNLFKRRSQQSLGADWHDAFGSGLDLSYTQIYLQEVNVMNDQVRTFWDQRDRVSAQVRAGFTLGPWGEIAARYRTDDDKLYSNAGGAKKEEADHTQASHAVVEARINVWSQTRLFVTYSKEAPFSYYSDYDPTLYENYSGLKLESTF